MLATTFLIKSIRYLLHQEKKSLTKQQSLYGQLKAGLLCNRLGYSKRVRRLHLYNLENSSTLAHADIYSNIKVSFILFSLEMPVSLYSRVSLQFFFLSYYMHICFMPNVCPSICSLELTSFCIVCLFYRNMSFRFAKRQDH